MLRQEPTVPIGNLVSILGRNRTTIAWWAKRLRVGHRGPGRAWRFTERDIERLEAVLHDPARRKR